MSSDNRIADKEPERTSDSAAVPFDDAHVRERPVYFGGGSNDLFGVFTAPMGEISGLGVVLMSARGTYHRNRLSVRLARRLARHGHGVLRFDTAGVGESGGGGDFDLNDPRTREVLGAARWLEGQGLTRTALVGSCFGAHSALAAAREVEKLSKIVLAVMPFADSDSLPSPRARGRVGRYLKVVFKVVTDSSSRPAAVAVIGRTLRRRWSRWEGNTAGRENGEPEDASAMGGWLDDLAAREVPVLLLFGAEDRAYRAFREATEGWPKVARAQEEGSIEVAVAAQQRIHGTTTIAAQDWFVDTVAQWLVTGTAGAMPAIDC